jgi:predicted  nucleic acid-binding Zn-ribbon protein
MMKSERRIIESLQNEVDRIYSRMVDLEETVEARGRTIADLENERDELKHKIEHLENQIKVSTDVVGWPS